MKRRRMQRVTLSPRPRRKHPEDTRFHICKKTRNNYCDICVKPFVFDGWFSGHYGNYVNADIKGMQPTEVEKAWQDGTKDLTWHCVYCEASLRGRHDYEKLAEEMDASRNHKHRKRKKYNQHRRWQ